MVPKGCPARSHCGSGLLFFLNMLRNTLTKAGREGLQTLTWGYVATGHGHVKLSCIGYRCIFSSGFAGLGLLKTVSMMVVELVPEPSRVCYLCLPRAGKDHNSLQAELSGVCPIASQPAPPRCQVAV